MADWDDDGVNVDGVVDDMIELTDIVMDGPGTEDDIIELTDIVKEGKPGPNPNRAKEEETGFDPDIIKAESAGEIENFDEDFDFVENTAMLSDTGSSGGDSEGFPALTSEQVEAALEKVIEKQFAGKIQTILFQVMEKVIEREIAGIRDSLQKDLDQIGTV
ncbi:MAG: hypothetical protein A2277_04265 [Desulfobacterales bacterium RIFOXYA12_FULL_46_15]|nr:MAG: hypothetical protein A2277_04265 [Desulfobacterales bacterium RIFOXYA12_FULL_46_15]